MYKTYLITTVIIFSFILSACTNLKTTNTNKNGSAQWDFDHNIQFKQTKLAKNHYQLEVVPNNKVSFERLATFLLRKSYNICQHYHYKLEIIQGVEGFDDKVAMPNYITPSLIAKIECQQKLLVQ